MEENITQAIEKRPTSGGGVELYCAVCALSLAKLAPPVSEKKVRGIIAAHVTGRQHKNNVNQINGQRVMQK